MTDIAQQVLAKFSAEKRGLPPSRSEIYTYVSDAAEILADEMRELAKAINARIDELEKNGARFRGVYQRAQAYRRGEMVTVKDGLWTALKDVPEGVTPGTDPDAWQLTVKGPR